MPLPTGQPEDRMPLGGDYCPDEWLEGDRRKSYGIADVHAHLMTHLAFGGRGFWGLPDGPPEVALGACAPMHGGLGLTFAALAEGRRHHGGGYPRFERWPSWEGLSHQGMYVDWIRRAYSRVACA